MSVSTEPHVVSSQASHWQVLVTCLIPRVRLDLGQHVCGLVLFATLLTVFRAGSCIAILDTLNHDNSVCRKPGMPNNYKLTDGLTH